MTAATQHALQTGREKRIVFDHEDTHQAILIPFRPVSKLSAQMQAGDSGGA